jgi:hypothetical protein
MPSGHFLPLSGQTSIGQRTLYGTWLPPGARVAAYVGPQSDTTDSYSTSSLLVSTLNAGLARCRSGKGDVVIVLPGHTETVSTADFYTSLVAGTRIIGVADMYSGLMPVLNFTATASTFLLDVANVQISGLKFTVGIDEVVNFVTVSGSGCRIDNCYFQVGTASTMDMDTAIIVATGATDCVITNNRFVGTSTAVNTNTISVTGTGVNNLVIENNFFSVSISSNGVIDLSGTAINIDINGNCVHNWGPTAPTGIRAADTALVGVIRNNQFFFTTDITVLTGSVSLTGVGTSSLRMVNNYGSDEDSLGGVLTPVLTNLE